LAARVLLAVAQLDGAVIGALTVLALHLTAYLLLDGDAAVRLEQTGGRLATSELAAFITSRALIMAVQQRSFQLRKSLVLLRRVVIPCAR
jgi:hypothetical protein